MTSLASSPPETRENVCLNPSCPNEATQRCSKCKAVRFCSRECQALLWDSHKSICKSIAKEPEATVLLLDGMGVIGPGSFYTIAVQAALERVGMKVATINIEKKPGLFQQVASILCELKRFTSCIALAVGSADRDLQSDFCYNRHFRKELLAWVQRGGRFIVQGERPDMMGNWPKWFGKTWVAPHYFRTTHECHAKSRDDVHWCKWYPEAEGSITSTINVKAVLLTRVATEDILFGTSDSAVTHSLVPSMAGQTVEEGLAAVALAKFGEGSVSFFGDVNAEDETCSIMAVIAHGP